MVNAMRLFGLFLATEDVEAKERAVPEPEFKPFRFPKREAAAAPAATLTPRTPRTLDELGVPVGLARELEAGFRALGLTRGDRVTGFTFRTADGRTYALKTAAEPAREVKGLAA